jgi:hypothetical protein
MRGTPAANAELGGAPLTSWQEFCFRRLAVLASEVGKKPLHTGLWVRILDDGDANGPEMSDNALGVAPTTCSPFSARRAPW